MKPDLEPKYWSSYRLFRIDIVGLGEHFDICSSESIKRSWRSTAFSWIDIKEVTPSLILGFVNTHQIWWELLFLEKFYKILTNYLAESSLNIFKGCLSSNANNSPPGQKSVIKQTWVGVCRSNGHYVRTWKISGKTMRNKNKQASNASNHVQIRYYIFRLPFSTSLENW